MPVLDSVMVRTYWGKTNERRVPSFQKCWQDESKNAVAPKEAVLRLYPKGQHRNCCGYSQIAVGVNIQNWPH